MSPFTMSGIVQIGSQFFFNKTVSWFLNFHETYDNWLRSYVRRLRQVRPRHRGPSKRAFMSLRWHGCIQRQIRPRHMGPSKRAFKSFRRHGCLRAFTLLCWRDYIGAFADYEQTAHDWWLEEWIGDKWRPPFRSCSPPFMSSATPGSRKVPGEGLSKFHEELTLCNTFAVVTIASL